MQDPAGRPRLFDEVAVPEGERICVHDDSACIALIPGGARRLLRLPLQRREVIPETGPLILHEDDVLLRHARDFIEAEVSEETCGIALRI